MIDPADYLEGYSKKSEYEDITSKENESKHWPNRVDHALVNTGTQKHTNSRSLDIHAVLGFKMYEYNPSNEAQNSTNKKTEGREF